MGLGTIGKSLLMRSSLSAMTARPLRNQQSPTAPCKTSRGEKPLLDTKTCPGAPHRSHLRFRAWGVWRIAEPAHAKKLQLRVAQL